MDYWSEDGKAGSPRVSVSRFHGEDGTDEYHLIVVPRLAGSIESQLADIEHAYRAAIASAGLSMSTAVLRRFFCSDPHNQTDALNACSISRPHQADNPCAVSWVGQIPAAPAKVALWAYHLSDPRGELNKRQSGHTLTLVRGDLAHHWTTRLTCPGHSGCRDQTRGIFDAYDRFLTEGGMRLADHVVRTWLFVRDIDADYADLVVMRREFFAARGLTPQTHFIASSGIQGADADIAARVTLDAYAVGNLHEQQIYFLAAPEHLSPTHVYGVTFERATSVAYHDREHIFISGTASIDHRGNILHHGDVGRQLERTLDNVEALLQQAGAAFRDMGHFIVYVRDPADHAVVDHRMRERFGSAPIVVITAPVCRPGWLVEVEGMAVLPASHSDCPAF
ncbi:MAG: translation initiation inhibitor [Phycisphaerae bacterium]|nr:translation initiation inhibitor [Phycisphaerae bacterium]